LAESVYLRVLSVARERDQWVVGAGGPPVDWVLQMGRLPRELMLDAVIAARSVNGRQIDNLAPAVSVCRPWDLRRRARASSAATGAAEGLR
jgi:aminoglycoside phosphotransferase family enzyme